jgi:hypothetical protein
VVGRIAAVVVMVVIGVVLRIHRGRHSGAVTRRRHRGTEAVVVVAVGAGAVVVANARRHRDDHPALGARPIPVEADGLEVFEGGEAVELVVQLVVGHDGEGAPSVDAAERDVDGDPLDAAGTDLHVFFGVAVAVVRIEVEGDITSIGVVADVLHVVVDRDRAVVIHHHGL